MPVTRRTQRKPAPKKPGTSKRARKTAKTAAPPGRLGLRAYARHRGVTLKTVQQARDEGRITVGADGKIDVKKADRAWAANTSAHQGGKRTPRPKPTGAAKRFMEHRTEKEGVLAALRRLEYEERAGKLIDRAKVEREWFEACRHIRDRVMAVPDRTAERIAAELGVDPGEVYDLLVQEHRSALTGLADVFQARVA